MDRGYTQENATVRAATEIAPDVRLLELVPAFGVQPYPLGSHLNVAVRIGGLLDWRSYSLVGRASVDGAYRIAVKRVANSRGGSVYMHGLHVGARLPISAPTTHFELTYGRSEYLLMAGGIGITALVGMTEELRRLGQQVRLVHAAATRAHLVFNDRLREQLGERLEVFVSAEGNRLDIGGQIARLDADGELYVCGPLRMLDDVRNAWRAQGRAPERLRFETFASSGRFASLPFVVRLRDYEDREITVPNDRTMLDALLDDGVDLVADCRRGECGLCQVEVLDTEGRLDHRDVFLSDEERREGRRLLTCVSRAVGGLVTVDTGLRA